MSTRHFGETDHEQLLDAYIEKAPEEPDTAEEPGGAEEQGAAEETGAAEKQGAAEETGATEEPNETEEFDSADDVLEELLRVARGEGLQKGASHGGAGGAYDMEDEADFVEEGASPVGEVEAFKELGDATASHPYLVGAQHKYHIWPAFITAAALFILLTGGLTYFNRTVMADQAAELASINQQGDDLLDESIAFIQAADSVVVALDKASDSKINEEDIPELEALLDQIDSTQQTLDSAIEKAEQARDVYVTNDKKALAQYAIDAAENRKEMLVISGQLTNYDIAAMRCASQLEYIWNQIIDADTNMRLAVEVVASEGAGGVSASRDYNQGALDMIIVAENAIADVPNIFPGVDVKALSDYLKARAESIELAIASDEAYMAGNYSTANAKNEEFKAKDLEVVELAMNMPSDLSEVIALVVTAYESTTHQLREEYEQLRLATADTDAYLRAYLGTGTP